ncbi:hypothetical protein CI1B_31380 [Bradyrhizobium ivorense]|uniref:Uncharacterized protein n=1 Tax=Bradyrhizobium ivorense TaxID=2511166 RepID=A0A508T9E0_9BRAD|nr:hypothetical protein CI1B_31380 [Bradyrhizobium ivorense]
MALEERDHSQVHAAGSIELCENAEHLNRSSRLGAGSGFARALVVLPGPRGRKGVTVQTI